MTVSDARLGDVLSSPVKLVIWDLDDTLWAGTLSEGPVELTESRCELIRSLNRRGIVNSICSKNDDVHARRRLEEAGLWDEFVFARIDWTPKGPRISSLIEDAQLRAENVLFVDDLPSNLAEARYFSPELQVAGPEILDTLLDLPQLTGKDDAARSRLQQYRLLEQKLSDQRTSTLSNESFLRSCDIQVEICGESVDEEERLFELAMRTNQLNFTKRRLDRAEFAQLLCDPGRTTGYVRVRDRYGDYGICGFFAVDDAHGELSDFAFSCRIMNMGIEQWLYARLGRPHLDVVGEVASELDGAVDVDWIAESVWTPFGDEVGAVGGARHSSASPEDARAERILMVGGCDLQATADFLSGDIATEFARTLSTGAHMFVGHTETLRLSASPLTDDQREVVARLPMVDESTYRSAAIVDPEYDALILSVLTDYTQCLYRHRATGLIVAWDQFTRDATDEHEWLALIQRVASPSVDGAFLATFAEEFEFLGGIAPERFQENIRWLSEAIPPQSHLVLLNGAEFPFTNPNEPDRHLRHSTMNAALEEVVAELPNASICDVRTFVNQRDDFTYNIRHYQRQNYLRMAEELRTVGVAALEVRPESRRIRVTRRARWLVGRAHVRVRSPTKSE
jgi:FkbH-like protein